MTKQKPNMILKNLGCEDNPDNIYGTSNYIVDESGLTDGWLPSEIEHYCRCQNVFRHSSESTRRRVISTKTLEYMRVRNLANLAKRWAERTSK